MLFPPAGLGMVCEGVYRSAMPGALSFPYLQSLRLRAVVALGLPDAAFAHFLRQTHRDTRAQTQTQTQTQTAEGQEQGQGQGQEQEQEPRQVSVTLLCRTQALPTEEEVVTALRVLSAAVSEGAGPVLVCCEDGKIATGIVVACFRKLHHWSLSSIFEEFRRHAGTTEVYAEEEMFIDMFDVEQLAGAPEDDDEEENATAAMMGPESAAVAVAAAAAFATPRSHAVSLVGGQLAGSTGKAVR